MNYSANECAAKKGWTIVKSAAVQGDGVLAPGAVTLCRIEGAHPFVIHFFNEQDGGFHSGDYCRDSATAELAYAKRVSRYVR